jgi:hypothetical protein
MSQRLRFFPRPRILQVVHRVISPSSEPFDRKGEPNVRQDNGTSSLRLLMCCIRSQGPAPSRSLARRERPRQEAHMKHIVLAAALALAALVGSLTVPVQAGPYWYAGSGPTTGGM